jgi:hypothetical protein
MVGRAGIEPATQEAAVLQTVAHTNRRADLNFSLGSSRLSGVKGNRTPIAVNVHLSVSSLLDTNRHPSKTTKFGSADGTCSRSVSVGDTR